MRVWKAVATAAAAVLVATGCSTNGSAVTTITDAARIAKMQEELSNPAMDLSKVTVAYMNVAGRNMQVASIMPVVLGESKSDREVARTIVRITPEHTGVTLFTKDARKQVAYLVTVPFDEFKQRGSVTFPVIAASGELVEVKIGFEKSFSK